MAEVWSTSDPRPFPTRWSEAERAMERVGGTMPSPMTEANLHGALAEIERRRPAPPAPLQVDYIVQRAADSFLGELARLRAHLDGIVSDQKNIKLRRLAESADHTALNDISPALMREPPTYVAAVEKLFGPMAREQPGRQWPAPVFSTAEAYRAATAKLIPVADEIEQWSRQISEVLSFEALTEERKLRSCCLA
jgi:hypothetical protein